MVAPLVGAKDLGVCFLNAISVMAGAEQRQLAGAIQFWPKEFPGGLAGPGESPYGVGQAVGTSGGLCLLPQVQPRALERGSAMTSKLLQEI